MTLVAEPRKDARSHNPLEPQLRLLLPGLTEADFMMLLNDLRSGAVRLSGIPLELRPQGVKANDIQGLEERRDKNTPEGMRRPGGYRANLSKAVRELHEAGGNATDKQRAKPGKIRQLIADAPQNHQAAVAALREAHERNTRRAAAFQRWIDACGLSSYWRQPDHMDQLVAALNPAVTYVHFMVTPGDIIGTLLVETD